MNVIVVGCGRVGSTLAYQLFKAGHQVAVVDQSAEAFYNLSPDFYGRMVEGDVLSREVLHRAGILEADGLAAVTNSDAVNATVAHVARTAYHIPHVVARNFDPRWRPLYEAFGLQVVSSAGWSAQRIEELLFGSALRVIFSAGNAEVEIYELEVPQGWQGRAVRELVPEDGCRVAALTRAGRGMLPSPDLALQTDDMVYLSATLEGIAELRRRIEAAPLEG